MFHRLARSPFAHVAGSVPLFFCGIGGALLGTVLLCRGIALAVAWVERDLRRQDAELEGC